MPKKKFALFTLFCAYRIHWWGAIFVSSAKIGLKTAKNVVFCILFRPFSSPAPPGYATARDRDLKNKNCKMPIFVSKVHYLRRTQNA